MTVGMRALLEGCTSGGEYEAVGVAGGSISRSLAWRDGASNETAVQHFREPKSFACLCIAEPPTLPGTVAGHTTTYVICRDCFSTSQLRAFAGMTSATSISTAEH